MIGKLKGIVEEKNDDHAILDVQGVGYEIYCSSRTLANLPQPGEAVMLWIETVVREDFIKLYGFASALERGWFRLLTTVQGVGAKVALAILSTLKISDISRALVMQDKAAFGQTSGVGPKLAARIVQELKDKAPIDNGSFVVAGGTPQAEGKQGEVLRDTVSALINLGYSSMQASEVTMKLLHADNDADAASLIRKALKELAVR